ncbi:MAG: hypothetical protein BGO39_03475 [Chloroflexi bacterium 54-19]|nr:MAG: hypothetical protein BGO39_03475 [Chloroflexi bacterium 54-19]
MLFLLFKFFLNLVLYDLFACLFNNIFILTTFPESVNPLSFIYPKFDQVYKGSLIKTGFNILKI